MRIPSVPVSKPHALSTRQYCRYYQYHPVVVNLPHRSDVRFPVAATDNERFFQVSKSMTSLGTITCIMYNEPSFAVVWSHHYTIINFF